jgi:hypothetical protein
MKDNNKAELEKAKAWAKENLLGKRIYQKDIDDYILFNIVGLNHMIYANSYDLKIKMVYQTLDLIEKSTLFSIEKDKKARPDIKAIFRFVSNWKYLDKEYFVYIVVRETRQGHFYYDHGIIKEKP